MARAVPKRRNRAGCLLLGSFALSVLICAGVLTSEQGQQGRSAERTASSATTDEPSEPDESVAEPEEEEEEPEDQPDAPGDEIVSALARVGFVDGLSGRGWHPSRLGDGTWVTIMRRSFGDNEVSFLLESSSRDTLDYMKLTAESASPSDSAATCWPPSPTPWT